MIVETEDLRARFHLPPLSPGVQRIAGLVGGRETASMEEIAEIISTDESMTRRLIIMAYPRISARDGATVEMAISRLGLNCTIVLLIGDLLTRAVTETFATMVSILLETDDPSLMPIEEHGHLTASVNFNGRTSGKVALSFSQELSGLIAARILGDGDEGEYPLDVITDAIGEIVNIVTGNLQSRLHDAGLDSKMEIPQVSANQDLVANSIPGASSEQFFFRQGTRGLGVNLCINPFSEN